MNAKVTLDGPVPGDSPRWHGGGPWAAARVARELITPGASGSRQVPAAGITAPGVRSADPGR